MRGPDGVAERNNGETSLFFGIALSSEVTNLGEATDSKLILIFSKSRLRIWFENIDVKMETLEMRIANVEMLQRKLNRKLRNSANTKWKS